MISLAEARSGLERDEHLLAVDSRGDIRPIPEGGVGPATALVRPIADALKLVSDSGLISGSVDRESAWAVERLVISGAVLARISDEFESLSDLYRAVEEAGFDWRISPTSSGP